MPATSPLSRRRLTNLPVGAWATESMGYGEGALQARRTRSGIRYYFRAPGVRRRIPLFSESNAGARLSEARAQARDLAAGKAVAGSSGAARLSDRSLGAMLLEYANYLAELDRKTAATLPGLFERHIADPFPALWQLPAAKVTTDDLMPAIRRLVDAGKLPTADRLRAYLSAAFAAAERAARDPRGERLERFAVNSKAGFEIEPVSGSWRTRDRALSAPELRALWRRAADLGGEHDVIVCFYLLTGAQRPTQLLRARWRDLSDDGLVLWDYKGRRDEPRRHVVPLIPPARECLGHLSGDHRDFIFSSDGGETALHTSTLYRWIRSLSEQMMAAGEVAEPFGPGDMRRTVETRLAALGVPGDVRAQLHSHGIRGIQARHYDRHDWLDEKRRALLAFYGLMDGANSVASITRPGRRRLVSPGRSGICSVGPAAPAPDWWDDRFFPAGDPRS